MRRREREGVAHLSVEHAAEPHAALVQERVRVAARVPHDLGHARRLEHARDLAQPADERARRRLGRRRGRGRGGLGGGLGGGAEGAADALHVEQEDALGRAELHEADGARARERDALLEGFDAGRRRSEGVFASARAIARATPRARSLTSRSTTTNGARRHASTTARIAAGVAPGATTSTRASSASRYAVTASSLGRARRRVLLRAPPRAAAPSASAAARFGLEGGGAIFSPHVGHFARSFLNLNAAPQFAHVSCSFLPIATDRSPAPRRARERARSR